MRWSPAAPLSVAVFLLTGCSESPRPDGPRDRSVEANVSTEAGPAEASARTDAGAPLPDLRPPDPNKTFWVSPTGAAPWTSCRGLTPLAGAGACSLATAGSSAVAGDTVVRIGAFETP